MKTVWFQRMIWISTITVELIFSAAAQCAAARTTDVDRLTQTSRIEKATSPSAASNSAAIRGRKILDDPPPREPGTKKRVHYLASFGLLVISMLVLIVGIGILRAFRQR